jgi:tripartite-type tricarboxylate transporter receptor subunit TctC
MIRQLLAPSSFAKRLCAAACAAFVLAAPSAQAQTAEQGYPKKMIKLVVPYPPGGGADTLARLVAAKMTDKLGQQVIVENKPGANTAIASEYVAKQPADGYTLLYVASSFTINPSLYKLRYSTDKDFAPIALVAQVPLIIVANNDFPVRSVADLIREAKRKPGQITFATYGTGSPVHLAGELFEMMTDTKLLHVPYKGSAPGLTDLVGGQVNLAFSSIEPSLALMRSNKIRAVAVTTRKRISAAPNVPTVAESGVPGFETAGWNGIVAPAGTPPGIVKRLNAVINEAVQLPEMRERFAVQGVEVDIKTPEAFASMIDGELVKWAALVKKANITVD